jgi:Uma2 family endonuclease
MGVMALSDVWPPDRLLTVDDLLDQPDDGNRYELVHGVLDVTPAPRSSHNRAVNRLCYLLTHLCPDGLEVLPGNGVNFARDHHRIPDVMIVHTEWVRRTVFIEQPPPLAIEVTSRSTRFRDTVTKKREYEKFGIRSYWIVDPDYQRPNLTVFELNRNKYRQVAQVTGDEAVHATRPFPITIVPALLVADGNEWKSGLS